jgi:predicted nucleic acid-binding protein
MAIDRNIYFGILLDRDTVKLLRLAAHELLLRCEDSPTSIPEIVAAVTIIAAHLDPEELADAVREMRKQQDDDYLEITDQ